MKARLNDKKEPNLFYMRTEKGVEVDLILRKKGMLFLFEIKSSMTPNKDFSRNMRLLCDSEPNAEAMNVVYCGEPYESFQNCRYIHYSDVSEYIK